MGKAMHVPIPLVNPETHKKISLRLRVMSLAQELGKLPVGIQEIQEQIIGFRNDHNLSIYNLVLYWNRLQLHDEYWKAFGFVTEAQYIAFYLPEGVTLGRWTTMVEMFDKATFVIAGPDALWFMVQLVSRYQTRPERRKSDYRQIFEEYCKQRDAFHKFQFMSLVRQYVERVYEEPQASGVGKTVAEWRGEMRVVPIVNNPPARSLVCESCVEKQRQLEVFEKYIVSLEGVIMRELGRDHLPEKPDDFEYL